MVDIDIVDDSDESDDEDPILDPTFERTLSDGKGHLHVKVRPGSGRRRKNTEKEDDKEIVEVYVISEMVLPHSITRDRSTKQY